MHEPLALEHFDERVELEIARGRNERRTLRRRFRRLLLRVVLLPVAAILLRAGEGIAEQVLHTHARAREAARLARLQGAVRLPHVLA